MGQRDTGVSILRGMMIAEGGRKSDLGVGMGVCVCGFHQSHSETAVSLSVTCWECNQLPSQGLCVLKARMRGTVELSSAGAVLLSRGR